LLAQGNGFLFSSGLVLAHTPPWRREGSAAGP
jgi:hypothetical protein